MSDPASKAVFLSYASQDAEAAKRICETLRAAGVEVWFDQDALVGGDAWDRKIRGQINSCALFIPVISANTQARAEGYFRLEWKLAEDRSHLMAKGIPFIVPVSVDATTERGALVPDAFTAVQWTKLPGGETSAAFVSRVQKLLGGSSAPVATLAPVAPASAGLAPAARSGLPLWAGVALGVVVLALIGFVALRPSVKDASPARKTVPDTRTPVADQASPPPALPTDKSLAVLPFANLSPDKDNEFFAGGVHGEILANLANIRELRVISAQSVSGYRGTTKRIPEIARELGVAYVLTASVQRAVDTVRISAQLIDARTDSAIWSPPPYTKKLTDIFALQSELAQSIAAELKAALSPEEKKLLERRPTENLAAYDLMLKANEITGIYIAGDPETTATKLNTRDAFLQAAVRLDPKFASAWAGIADNHLDFIVTNTDRSPARYAMAKTALEEAIRLEPDSPSVIGTHVYYLSRTNADRALIAEQIERLLKFAPNTADAYRILSGFQFGDGRYAEAVMNIQKAARLDPRNADTAAQEAGDLWRARRHAEAAEARRRLLTLRPASVLDRFDAARMAFQASGSTREMESLADELTAKDTNTTEAVPARHLSAVWGGGWGDAMRFAGQLPLPPTAVPGNAPGFVNGDGTGDMALIYLRKGDAEAARKRLGNFPSQLRATLNREPNNTRVIRYLATLEAIAGERESAVRLAEQSLRITSVSLSGFARQNAREVLAQVCAIIGDKDRAIAELTHLLNTPSQVNIHELKVMPVYFNLRGDPRFEALINDPKNNAPLF